MSIDRVCFRVIFRIHLKSNYSALVDFVDFLDFSLPVASDDIWQEFVDHAVTTITSVLTIVEV